MKRLALTCFATNIQDLLQRIGAEADKAGLRVYLVGGAVRDLVLKCASSDMDIVVEGDGEAFARRLARKLGASAVFHEKFRTATLTLKDGAVVDVVTARRETYAQGGALPDIVPATIREDLQRRDFTINALALGLNAEGLGVLRDDLEGMKDIETKIVRIMHENSFVDDPTRILRAARYAVRFGFQLDALTQDVLDQAVAADVLRTITPVRYFLELRRILDEQEPAPVLDLLVSWDALRYAPYEADDRARLIAAGSGWAPRLAALVQGLPVDQARGLLVSFNISKTAQKNIL